MPRFTSRTIHDRLVPFRKAPEDASAVDVWKMIETLAEQNGGKLPVEVEGATSRYTYRYPDGSETRTTLETERNGEDVTLVVRKSAERWLAALFLAYEACSKRDS